MDAVRHATLARQLIEACGGATQVAGNACRLEKTRLYECCDPGSGAFLPADVIVDLESYCGEPIYSRAMVEHRPAREEVQGLVDETSDGTELMAGLQALARRAAADGTIDAKERASIFAVLETIEEKTRKIRAAAAAPGARP